MKNLWLGILLTSIAFDTQALGRLADVQILDRASGAILPVYRHGGDYWVAGIPGNRYSIVICNPRGERLLAVTAVDGVNVISGETGAWGQNGYVYSPGERYSIDGWRKSDQEIAAFEFTAAPQSYAARTGRPANVGVIGVALFLERPQPPMASVAPRMRESFAENGLDAPAGLPPMPSPSSAAGAAAGLSAPPPTMDSVESARSANSPVPQLLAKLGTGHGQREASLVYSTQFERQSSMPNEIVRIRYDSLANLVAMGVIPGRPPMLRPYAFPDSAVSQYVPDPPRDFNGGRR